MRTNGKLREASQKKRRGREIGETKVGRAKRRENGKSGGEERGLDGGKEEGEERDEIIARLVVCCHPDQIAYPPPFSHLLPSPLLLLSRSADASFPLLSLQTSNTAAIPAMCAVHQSNNDFHSHTTRAVRGAEQTKATERERSEKEYDRLSYLALRFEELNSVKLGKGKLCGQLEQIMLSKRISIMSVAVIIISVCLVCPVFFHKSD